MNNTYKTFLETKTQANQGDGFEPLWIPDFLFPFQKYLSEWSLRMGRAGNFSDCGMGKGPMELVWAENVYRKTGKPVLILTPLAVSHQLQREAEKFQIEAKRSDSGKVTSSITITNYERLHLFNTDDYGGVVCDESSILKNFAGKRRAEITEFVRTQKYRLLGTATAAPNDFDELGTSSEALGYLGYTDMITRFFKEDIAKDFLGWGRKTYRFKGHAEQPFWRWVCSWARVCRKPSDLGFSDEGFVLPELIEQERFIETSKPRDGMLFALPAQGLEDQREERWNTLTERCEAAAAKALEHDGASVIWCHLNDEGDLTEKLIPGVVQVSGSMADDKKEERLLAFQSGDVKKLVIKPRIGCFGLNWQHCHDVITFPSHSWEQYYQAVRRCWRFGQKNPVTVTVISSEGERGVLANLKRKSEQADRMFSALTTYANQALKINRTESFSRKSKLPSWIGASK